MMMLNKELCKRCCNMTPTKWCPDDDMRWEKGTVLCPFVYSKEGVSQTKDELIEKCVYALEHLLSMSHAE